LAILLLPISKSKAPKGKPGRLTIVSSGTALFAKFPNQDNRPLLSSFDNPKTQPWDPFERYSSSKMLGHLFFSRIIDYVNAGDVVVNLVEPGMCKGTEIARRVTGFPSFFMNVFMRLAGRTPEDGAWTYVDAAVLQGKKSHGCFCLDGIVHP
jgi:NAD(P)-dependent dehydrogenase (short-subunit alcohol dehydrogenase family)